MARFDSSRRPSCVSGHLNLRSYWITDSWDMHPLETVCPGAWFPNASAFLLDAVYPCWETFGEPIHLLSGWNTHHPWYIHAYLTSCPLIWSLSCAAVTNRAGLRRAKELFRDTETVNELWVTGERGWIMRIRIERTLFRERTSCNLIFSQSNEMVDARYEI